ncbi:Mu-like prophage FluMu protein gp28 [Azorhizobium caulinodans ORS 571]|uniref:Mu-like prophage FluMu protein gp28 n=1 Tax=Azorhizobium caulinodans (strain ATCC 43989 / DSM 5975 / JCM 20966 / LMG 6465 / NBRC 14845 / NCIMB 13405 / ORS 571) TaxID=438753 RepID=A8I7N6_AZOC5|nr:terminase family protein [Azorhizobium caulinodans]BAF88140.1 Mu-like prophage FluMu protein gp28 [Azorhizobium caulinodans ORS 571]
MSEAPMSASSFSGGPVSEAEWVEARRASLLNLPQAHADGRLPSLLLPYQARGIDILDDPRTRVLVVEKSRRIGYTWGLAAHAVLKASRAREARGMDVMYISYSQEMTREFVDAAAMWARAFALAAAAEEEFLFADADPDDPGETREIKAFRIRFASGFEIIALSSAPRSLRGKQGLVIIDEAAFVESLKELLKAALAFLMWGGQVVVVSTHNGDANPFNELVQDVLAGRKPYAHVRIDFDQALKDGLYQRICLVTGDSWTPETEAAWRSQIIAFYGEGADEELFCTPSEGTGAWLPGPLVEARMREGIPVLRWELPADFLHRPRLIREAMVARFTEEVRRALDRLDPNRQHALGFDFARVADLSVLWVLALSPTTRRETVLVIEMRRIPYDEQATLTVDVIRRLPRFMAAVFDATGAGEYVAENAQRRISLSACIAQKLSVEWYRTQMPPLKAAFEDDMVTVPKDAEILADLRLVQTVRGVAQPPTLRTGDTGRKRHADAAVALALAYHATRISVLEYDYQTGSDLDAVAAGDEDDTSGGRALW